MSKFEVIKKEDQVEVSKGNTNICIKETEDGLSLTYKGNINFNIDGNLTMSINGETNIISRGFNLDTLFDYFKTKLNLNGRWSKQIKDRPEAIAYREKQKKRLEEIMVIEDGSS